MINLMKANKTAVVLASLGLLLILERIFLDFRYVAIEMEAPQAFMPFTLPYMGFAFVIIGGWIWALLAAHKGSRAALIVLLILNAFGLFFAVSTMATLCPLPCQTASPISDILIISQLVISIAAMLSAGLAWWSGRTQAVTGRSPQGD